MSGNGGTENACLAAFDILRADDHDADDHGHDPDDADASDDIDERLADGWGHALTDSTPWHGLS